MKRTFDVIVSFIGLLLIWWFIGGLILLSFISTKKMGLFSQQRVGLNGKIFKIYKIRTMASDGDNSRANTTTVTTAKDGRITKIGKVIRRLKLDELPQLYNVIIGDMSLVGPRPDVPGFADTLEGEDRIILSVKPGITGPASIYYKNEEDILAKQQDPEKYNSDVIWPIKIALNKEYVKNYSLSLDIKYLIKTLF